MEEVINKVDRPKWWLKTRNVRNGTLPFDDWGNTAPKELYVPWWAWPLELLFGSDKIITIK